MTLQQQLNQINVSQLVMSNGLTVHENFINEADRLERILTEVFKEVMATRYEHIDNPLYERTGQLLNSIVVDVPSFKVNKKQMSIEVGFSKSGFHHSGDGLDGMNGRTYFLLLPKNHSMWLLLFIQDIQSRHRGLEIFILLVLDRSLVSGIRKTGCRKLLTDSRKIILWE